MKVAGIDVHKKVLMVVVVDASALEEKPARPQRREIFDHDESCKRKLCSQGPAF